MNVTEIDDMEVRYIEEAFREDLAEVLERERQDREAGYHIAMPESTMMFREVRQPLHPATIDVTDPANQADYLMAETGHTLESLEAAPNMYALFVNRSENAWAVVVFRPSALVYPPDGIPPELRF